MLGVWGRPWQEEKTAWPEWCNVEVRGVDDVEGRLYPPADRGTKADVTGGHWVCGIHTVWGLTGGSRGSLSGLRGGNRYRARGSPIHGQRHPSGDNVRYFFCKADADKSPSRLSCMFASAAGKSSGTVPPFNSIAIVSNKGSTVARSLAGEASIIPLVRRNEYFKKRHFFYTSRTRGTLGAREFSTNDSDGARTGARSLPTRHAESSFFPSFSISCWQIFEVKQSSVKKERVFHTQERKMLHSHSAEIQELCESRSGCPGLSVLMSLLVSVDVKIYWTVLRHWSQLVPNMSTDIWGH